MIMKRTVFLSCVVLLALFVVARSDVLAQEHCVSGKLSDFVVGDTGEKYGEFTQNYALITWKEMKDGSLPLEDVPPSALGFFYARLKTREDVDAYEFILISIRDTAKETIEGKFNIYHGGSLIHESCPGVFSLDMDTDPNGNLFTFEINDRSCNDRGKWQFKGVVDARIDRP